MTSEEQRLKSLQSCWNCGSGRYYETASIEECPDCGISCNYHDGGANAAYDAALLRVQAEDEARENDAYEDAIEDDWS